MHIELGFLNARTPTFSNVAAALAAWCFDERIVASA